jgi:hypothetical protein
VKSFAFGEEVILSSNISLTRSDKFDATALSHGMWIATHRNASTIRAILRVTFLLDIEKSDEFIAIPICIITPSVKLDSPVEAQTPSNGAAGSRFSKSLIWLFKRTDYYRKLEN